MAESAAASNAQLLTLLAGLPKTLFGSTTNKTTSGGSLTEQTMFSKEAIDSLLRGIMEGTSGGRGFAEVAAGQRAPGLYNATTRNMLMNDYATRAAGVVAEKTAPKVTTRGGLTESTKIPGMMSKGTGLALGAALLGGTKKGRQTLEDLFKDISLPGFGGKDMSGVMSFDEVSPGSFLNSAGMGIPDFGGNLSAIDSFFPDAANFSMFSDSAAFAGDSLSAAMDFGSAASSGVDAFGNISTTADWTSGFDLAEGGAVATDGMDIGLTGLGSLMRGDYSDAATEAAIAAFVPGGPIIVAADNLLGTDITGQVGDKVFDDLLGGVTGKVICTELCRQGLLSKHVYIEEATTNLKRLSATTLAGYHYIAIPVVHRMRKSKALSQFLLPWVLDYSNEVIYRTGGIRGKFVRYVLEPVCYVVGLAVGMQDYKSLYKAA
jgi:hypothetical protein